MSYKDTPEVGDLVYRYEEVYYRVEHKVERPYVKVRTLEYRVWSVTDKQFTISIGGDIIMIDSENHKGFAHKDKLRAKEDFIRRLVEHEEIIARCRCAVYD